MPVSKATSQNAKQVLSISAMMSACTAALILFCFSQCATPVAPKGGPKDHTPPAVIADESTPNPMINYDLDEIRITLDEWVQLNSPATQIVISPPIEPRPFPRLDRKTVVIPIDPATLLDNTTYTINFGESIQDITERNPLVNHTFVFSKGPFVDSLSISGVVINAHTGEPEPDARFILHDNPSDSAISTVLPSYFSTTDDNGRFQLNYLRPDTFRGYAIKEAEFGNYRYNVGEQLGFLSEPVILHDTAAVDVRIWIYYPEIPIRAIPVRREAGIWKIALTREASFIELAGDTAALLYWEHTRDTIKIWHMSPDTLDLHILEAGVPFDTIKITPYVPEASFVSLKMRSGKIHPDDPVRLKARNPVASVNTSLVRLAQGDSVQISSFSMVLDEVDPRNIFVKTAWVEKARYYLTLLPGAVTDIYGNSNDTIEFVTSFDERVNFGLLKLTLANFDPAIQYIVIIMDGNTERESQIVNSKTDSVLVYNRLPAKDYIAKIIEDGNKNGRWDTGDLATKRQPERIFMQKLEGMRPGWDLDLTITWPEK